MEFYIVAILVVLFILLIPYIRMFFKRLSLYFKLKSLCSKYNYRLVGNHFGWIFGRKSCIDNDFYIETSQRIYSVKLFSVKRRLNTLIFDNTGKYYIRKHIAFISNIGALATFSFNSKPKPVIDYNFRKNFKDEWYIKELVPVLLVNPVCKEILYSTSNSVTEPIDPQKTIYDMKINSLSELIRELETKMLIDDLNVSR